jgi:hypothetical protein
MPAAAYPLAMWARPSRPDMHGLVVSSALKSEVGEGYQLTVVLPLPFAVRLVVFFACLVAH